MKKYVVSIEETVVGEFEVEAENSKEAMEIAQEKYIKGKFVLEPGELQSKRMAIVEPTVEYTKWEEF